MAQLRVLTFQELQHDFLKAIGDALSLAIRVVSPFAPKLNRRDVMIAAVLQAERTTSFALSERLVISPADNSPSSIALSGFASECEPVFCVF